MKLHFLKTKWSDMIILEEGGKIALIDTGFDEQEEQLCSYIDALGVKEIDFILLTHFHRDHYGNIPALVKRYKVGTVYMKEYSGLDSTTSWGSPADNAYRSAEMIKYNDMCSVVSQHSTLAHAEDFMSVFFCGHELRLFSNGNTIKEIYNDAAYPETYRKILFSENQNSLAVFMCLNGKTIFLGGDVMDIPSPHPLADCVNTRIAREIGRRMDIMKASHHGTVHTMSDEALDIYCPETVVITNEEEYLAGSSDILERLIAARVDVNILLTENEDVVIEI